MAEATSRWRRRLEDSDSDEGGGPRAPTAPAAGLNADEVEFLNASADDEFGPLDVVTPPPRHDVPAVPSAEDAALVPGNTSEMAFIAQFASRNDAAEFADTPLPGAVPRMRTTTASFTQVTTLRIEPPPPPKKDEPATPDERALRLMKARTFGSVPGYVPARGAMRSQRVALRQKRKADVAMPPVPRATAPADDNGDARYYITAPGEDVHADEDTDTVVPAAVLVDATDVMRVGASPPPTGSSAGDADKRRRRDTADGDEDMCILCEVRVLGETTARDGRWAWIDEFVRSLHIYYRENRLQMQPRRLFRNICMMWENTLRRPFLRQTKHTFVEAMLASMAESKGRDRSHQALAPPLSYKHCVRHFTECVFDPRNVVLQNMELLNTSVAVLEDRILVRNQDGTSGMDELNLLLLKEQRMAIGALHDSLKLLIGIRSAPDGSFFIGRALGASSDGIDAPEGAGGKRGGPAGGSKGV